MSKLLHRGGHREHDDAQPDDVQPEPATEPTTAAAGDNDRYDLIKFRVLQEIQGEIVAWGKRRLAILTAVGAIVGVFGGHFLVDNAIRSMVDDPVKARLHQLEDAMGDLNRALASSKVTTTAAQDAIGASAAATRNATDAAKKATEALLEIQSKAVDLERKLAGLTGTIDSYSTAVFETDTKREFRDIIFARNAEYLAQSLHKLESFVGELSAAVTSGPITSETFNARYKVLLEEQQAAKKAHDEAIARLELHSKYKVVIYIQRRIGVDTIAESLAGRLRDEGFRAELWRANGSDAEEAARDIRSEFWNIESAFTKSKQALVVRRNSKIIADDVERILRDGNTIGDVPVIVEEIMPGNDHLQSAHGEMYSPDQVLLLYVLANS